MKTKIFTLIFCITVVASAMAFTKTFNHPFGQHKGDKWYTVNSSISSVTNGVLNCTMGGPTSGKYRGDLWYNYTGTATVSTDYNFTLYPDRDIYLAIKFIGARPDGSLKLEMYTAANTWMNTQWSAGVDGTVTATNGDVIYYFRLTKDITYTGTSIDIQRLHLVIADAVVSTTYAVDWIATFQTTADITSYKDASDDVIELAANGDLIATTSGTYATTGNWSVSDGSGGFSAAGAAPTATENAWIPEGITITTDALSYCKNLIVEGTLTTGNYQAEIKENLTIKSSGVFKTVNTNNGTVNNLIIGGNLASGPCNIQVDGQFGSINGTTGAGSGFRTQIDAGGTTTFQGYGKMNVAILRPNTNNGRTQTWVFDMDANFLNTANNLQTLTLTNGNASAATKKLIINAGKTVTFSTNNANSVLGGQTNTTTNQSSTGGNMIYEINGTLNTGAAGGLWLTTSINTGATTGLNQSITLKVGATGKLIVGPKVLTGVAQPLTQSIVYDFAAGSTIEYSGSTATTFSASTTTGAIQSYMNSFSNLKINNSGGVTLPVTITVNNTLDLGSGVLATGSNTLILKGAISGSGAINTGISGTLVFAGISEQILANTNLTSNSVNNLTINAGSKLTTSGDFTATTINILSNATNGTGTLINGGTVTNTNASVQQYFPDARNWYVSSPVSNALAPSGYTYYRYNEGAANWTSSPVIVGDQLIKGTGYIALPGSAASTLTFTTQSGGTLNTGNVDIMLSRSGATKTGFNLIGNPYPSHLTWTKTFVDNNALLIEPTIWYRTNAGTVNNSGQWSFKTINASTGEASPLGTTNVIPPMQAFWVRAVSAGTLTLNSDLTKSHQTSNPLKAPAVKRSERQRLRLQVDNGTSTDETLIYFDENASDNFDRYDSPKFAEANTATQIFTTADTEKLVINGMNKIPLDSPVGLGFAAGDATLFSIRANEVSNLPEDVKVILKDNVTLVETDLTDGVSSYQFSTETTSADCFSIIFRSAGATTGVNKDTENNLLVYWDSNQKLTLKINDEKLIGSTMSVYNVVGQQLKTEKITGTTMHVNFPYAPDLYLVKVNNVTTKVIVK